MGVTYNKQNSIVTLNYRHIIIELYNNKLFFFFIVNDF